MKSLCPNHRACGIKVKLTLTLTSACIYIFSLALNPLMCCITRCIKTLSDINSSEEEECWLCYGPSVCVCFHFFLLWLIHLPPAHQMNTAFALRAFHTSHSHVFKRCSGVIIESFYSWMPDCVTACFTCPCHLPTRLSTLIFSLLLSVILLFFPWPLAALHVFILPLCPLLCTDHVSSQCCLMCAVMFGLVCVCV